ncbi:MAG: methyltransferase domain-containing protein [Nevskia sp.]
MSSLILCPLCRLPLQRQPKVWTCANRHGFDVARDGHVNLLPVQHKHSREPGDRPEMIVARREFLQAGHYAPLREAAVAMIAALGRPASLLDIGCGEGYYTSAFAAVAAEVIGLDIAKPAVQMAAKRHKGPTWLVGSGALLPVADGTVDVVATLFTPLHVAEIARVLGAGGSVLIATPAADHLLSLREGLFDEVRAHEPDKFIAEFAPAFELAERRDVRVPLALTQATLKQLLLMTPYVWKARPEKRAALEQHAQFETTAAFSLMRFRRLATSG